jgi:hypothetical protein
VNNVRYEDVGEAYIEIDGDEVVFIQPTKSRRTAEVVPFPVSRQHARLAALRQRAAKFPNRRQQWLASQVDRHAERLAALGVDGGTINREIDDMAIALGLMSAPSEAALA